MKHFREFFLLGRYEGTEGKTMKCKEFQKQISKLIDKELPGNYRDALFDHLQSCSECSRFYERAERIEMTLNAALRVAPDTALAQSVKDRIAQKRKGIVPEHSPVFWKRVPVYALVALLAVGVGNIAGKTLTQAFLDQSPETTLELLIPNGIEYVSDIFGDMNQGDQPK